MRMIVGLGNPGRQYEKTRHNAGFLVIDELLRRLHVELKDNKFKGHYTIYNHRGEKILLLKPETFMNLSGEAVLALKNYYDIATEDIIVIHDDMDLPLGKIRIREKGSAGGQKGMGNIIDLLKTDRIKRIRIGIAHDRSIDTKDYVLGRFAKEELPVMEAAFAKAAEALEFSFDNAFSMVMNRYNQ